MKYFIKFTQLLSCIYWGEAALLWQAYNGLSKQIKNEMVHHKKPTTLSRLRKLVQAINTHYWERKVEIARQTPAMSSSCNKSEKNNNNKSSSNKGKCSSQSKQNNNNNSSSGSSQNQGKSLEPKKMSTPDLSSKLRKDRKLTPQERQRRLDKNLCLFCSAPNCRAADCNKAAVAAKARTSKTTPATMESTSTPSIAAQRQKKNEQSLRLRMTQGLC